MDIILFNGIRFSIEFIKIILINVCFFHISLKKRVNGFFAIALFLVLFFSYWFDFSRYCVLFGLISISLLILSLYEIKHLCTVILSYLLLCAVDLFCANLCINLFHINVKQLQNNSIVNIALNSISLFIFIICSLIGKHKNNTEHTTLPSNFLPVFMLGSISLSVYLTATQFMALGKNHLTFRYVCVIGTIMITGVFIIICYLLLENKNENQRLKIESVMNHRLLAAQKKYYTMLLQKEEETKAFRHDFNEHIICLQMLLSQKRYKELSIYLSQIKNSTKTLSAKFETGNLYVNAILSDLSSQFHSVTVDFIGQIPTLTITPMDTCTLFFNLLKNAFEAALKSEKQNIFLIVKVQEANLVISISNHYNELTKNADGDFVTTKTGDEHGYGLRNVKRCVAKYNGLYSVTTTNHVFHTEIILPNVILFDKVFDER